MSAIAHLVNDLRARSRAERANIFRAHFHLGPDSRVLNFGSGVGGSVAMVLQGAGVPPGNIYIADGRADLVEKGHALYGFSPVVIPESERLPFEDGFFDVVYCSTLACASRTLSAEGGEPQAQSGCVRGNDAQRARMASEIRRLGRGYFVQAPNRWFPIETDTWLPFGSYLPAFASLLRREPSGASLARLRWLTARQMRSLFPDADILRERVFGVTKSIIAIKGMK